MTLSFPRRGFTLIELSIVLVIVGLLVGGVLVGREIIKTAELRSVLTQVERYDVAIGAFRIKFHCLPGDCPHASEFDMADAACPVADYAAAPIPCGPDNGNSYQYAGCNGNGDEMINNSGGPATLQYAWCPEHLNIWHHLSRANLVNGTFDGKTLKVASTLGNIWIPMPGLSGPVTRLRDVNIYARFGNAYVLGNSYLFPNTGELQVQEAHWLDSKVDDGQPLTGRARCTTSGCYTVPAYNYDLMASPNSLIYMLMRMQHFSGDLP